MEICSHSQWVVWVYGAFILLGGVMGWVKAKSKPSLISGTLFGVLLIADGFWMSSDRHNALIAGVALAGILLVVMGIRFVRTKKFMPAGLTASLSLIVALILVTALLR